MADLLDSGARREFESGAVRDITEGKGRCDLLPLDVLAAFFTVDGTPDRVFMGLSNYVGFGLVRELYGVLDAFNEYHWRDNRTMMLEAAKQYEDGAKKYAERNWEKGIPLHCYIDSGVRHYLKFLRGDTDEPHDRAFVWNILCAIRTHNYKPQFIDLPFNAKKEKNNEQTSSIK